jgi:hypothetical protein
MIHTEYYKDGTTCECDEMKRFYNCTIVGATLETPYINGKANGIEKLYFYDSGALWSTTPHVNNKRHGIQKRYYESGLLEKEDLCIRNISYNRPMENFL